MNVKAGFILAACLLILISPALALNETFATCQMPEGSESLFVTDAASFQVPAGLEGMYALMRDANQQSDVYLIRMRFGRALASVSCTSGVEPGTAQSLLALWPDIAKRIGEGVTYVNGDPSCAKVEEALGFEALTIQTDIAVGGESMVLLDARCAAFYHDGDLIEVWSVCPADPVYLYDDEAAKELESDRADLKQFISGLSFPSGGDVETSPKQ